MRCVTPAWRNLGRWAPGRSYLDAQIALADAVAEAAGPLEGRTVVELGCGAGAGLVRWVEHFGAARAIGYDPATQPSLRNPRIEQVRGRARDLRHEADVVLAVDAAYHFDLPRTLGAVRRHLRPGGTLVFTDILLDATGRRARSTAWGLGRLCRFGPGAPRPEDELRAQVTQAGLTSLDLTDLTDEVLGGFARYVGRGPPIEPAERLPFHLTARFARWTVETRAARYALIRARA